MLPSSPRPSARVSVLALLVLCLVGFVARPAAAWVEIDVRAHRATVGVEPDGRAEVRHELLLRVRGGPLQSLEIEGVGQELGPLGDATVRAVGKGLGRVWPLKLEPRDDGALVLRIGAEKGLRSGVYRFEFGYRFDLGERGWLERRGDRARLTWVQPRFSGGIDSAQVLFRVPHAAMEPRLPEEEDGPAAAVLLTEVRRGPELDEVELVRAHVARGEPAVWQVEVDAAVFPGLEAESVATVRAPSSSTPPPPRQLLPRTPAWMWSFGAALGLLYALVLGLKWRAVRRSCAELGVTPRVLVPIPASLRVLGAGALLGVATTFALLESLTWAGLAWAGALLLAALLPPWREPRPRGPGEWARLDEGEARRPQRRADFGRWLDGSDSRGALLLVGIVAATCAAAWALLSASPYRAGLTLMSLSGWLPIFLTGRASDMPADPAWGSVPLYRWLAKRLERDQGVACELWARRPVRAAARGPELGEELASPKEDVDPADDRASRGGPSGGAASDCDEIRLRVLHERALPGVRAIEVGVEIGGGVVALPCVVVRVQDDSPAYRALPHSVHWVRGRTGEERVTILRPRVPTRGQCLQLLTGVLRLLSAGQEGAKAPRRGARVGGQAQRGASPSSAHEAPTMPRPLQRTLST